MRIRKVVRGFFYCLVLWALVSKSVLGAGLNLVSKAAVLMDGETGRILYEKDGNTPFPNASTTKILTCILVLEKGKMEDSVTVSSYAANQPKVKLGMRTGESYQVKDLLYSMMLESHNDSAVVLAEYVAGTVEGFANLMNVKANEIGCKYTYFVTPNGLDGERESRIHATSAADLATIMRYCIKLSPKRELFLEITQTQSYTFDSNGRKFSCQNHNTLLGLLPEAITGKTGYTANAGYCYVGAAKQDGGTIIISLLGCGWPPEKNRKWDDFCKLYRYSVENFCFCEYEANPGLPELVAEGGWEEGNPYVHPKVSLSVIGMLKFYPFFARKEERVKTVFAIPDHLHAPVEKGQKIGEVLYLLEGENSSDFMLGKQAIIVGESIEKRNFSYILSYVLKCFLAM